MLILPIKKKWFDMILSSEKKEEYRELKKYYETRFANDLIKRYPYSYECPLEAINDIERQEYDVMFRNGYRKDSPKLKCKVEIFRGQGKPEWGAGPNKEYYVLKILSVEMDNNDSKRDV